MASDSVHVAVAVIIRNEKILITKRPQHLHQGGLWEFPGGKLELDESVQDALVRELFEELDIEATHYTPLIRIHHDYGDKDVLLDVWRVSAFDGEPRGCEGQDMRWVSSIELTEYRFPAANQAILQSLRLPTHCLITPEPIDNDAFLNRLQASLQDGVRLVQFRAKTLQAAQYLTLAQEVEKLCLKFRATLLLNTPLKNFQKTQSSGLHLSAERLMLLSNRPVADGVLLSAACHTREEVEHANRLGVDLIFVSPVQHTLSHPDTSAIGWQTFNALTELACMPVYALGGMEYDDV
ncbi:MAG: Nudix family hydrolase, partial [Gammaproteobacteria bacterium]|nr:Nudix family hydrolase [Gammaproteobacteria bacterium]